MTDATTTAERPVEWRVVEAWTTGNGLLQMRLIDSDDIRTYLIAALKRHGWFGIERIGKTPVRFMRPVVLEFERRSGCLERVELP